MSEKPFVLFLFAFVPSAILVFGAALLFSRVELPTAMLTNVPQHSTHAKNMVGPAGSETANSVEMTGTVNAAESPRGRVEGKVKNMGQIFKAEAVAPKLERDEPTPQGADDAQQETAAAAHIADASQLPQTFHHLFSKPHLKPVALGPSVTPTTSAADAPAPSANASRYGTRVWAELAHHKPKAVQHGSTTVSFQIGASGALGYVRVDQSSGNARVDQLALQTVRDSAPFPPPPNGASSYTIRMDFE